jgi:hypothetical protein
MNSIAESIGTMRFAAPEIRSCLELNAPVQLQVSRSILVILRSCVDKEPMQ